MSLADITLIVKGYASALSKKYYPVIVTGHSEDALYFLTHKGWWRTSYTGASFIFTEELVPFPGWLWILLSDSSSEGKKHYTGVTVDLMEPSNI